MKKYRSLWCMSTTNHNILYFLNIRGIRLVNNGNRLWKAQKAQAWRGVGLPILPHMLCNRGFAGVSGLIQSVVLGGGGGKAQKRCRLGADCVEKWTTAFNLPPDWA
jgi:hypothetical protein